MFVQLSKFTKWFETNPEYLGPALSSLLGPKGIHSSVEAVRTSACLHVRRLLRGVGSVCLSQLVNHIPQILISLQKVVSTVLGRVQGEQMGQKLISHERCCNLCEVMGMLIVAEVDITKNVEVFRTRFQTILNEFSNMLQAGIKEKDVLLRTDPERAGKRFAQLIDAITNTIKPFSFTHTKVTSDLFLPTMESVFFVAIILPKHKVTHSKFLFFYLLHIIYV